jgi:glycosyltransferase involved in cell wall biosynthesis
MTGLAGVRVAIVNWRDPWHPEAGGAEQYAWELAVRLQARGADVRFVTARAEGQARTETIDGIELARMGGRFTVYPRVLAWFLRRRRRHDAVIDCQNGIPFFTPWVLPRRVPVFCLVHHVHDGQFGLYFPGWLARIGRLLEGPVARWTYRRDACVAVSRSTMRAMRERLAWQGPIHLIPPGLTIRQPAGDVGRGELVCVSRLVPHKRIERIIDCAERLTRHVDIVGDGPAAEELAKRVADRGLADLVTFHGYVSEETKAALIARARLHLSATQGEGWGLSVTEAAALGVPTVAYDVDGLRDAVQDGVTGWLVSGDEDLAGAVTRALAELDRPGRRAEVAAACREWAAQYDWDRSTDRMATLVSEALRR